MVSRDTMTPCRSGRPSEGERWNKINAARKLVENGNWEAPNPGKLDDDLRELEEEFGTEWATDEDKLVLFREALSEVRAEHYCETGRQPEQSKELRTADLEMWKFKWQSRKGLLWQVPNVHQVFSHRNWRTRPSLYLLTSY